MRITRLRQREQNNDRSGHDSSDSNQGSFATGFNNNITLLFESNPQICVRGDSLATIKKPNEFNEKIDVETWLVQLEIY